MDKTSSMYLYVKLNWDANRFLPAESKDCMNSASYEYRNMSARRGAQFVPIGIPTICWKTFPAKTTKMLSTRNSKLEMHSLLYVPVQTIVSPCDAKCVTPLIYPTTDLDFLLGMIVLFDLSFYFLIFETCAQPFCNGIIPSLWLPYNKACTVHR